MSESPRTPDPAELPATRITAPRPLSQAPTIIGGTRLTTSLPAVEWSEQGASLAERSLPRYETVDRLGEGGMGEVVKAIDNDIGRTVAVKRLRPDMQHPELFARFVEEVRTVGQLEHPNIVPIHDAGHDEGGYYFVMKHVEGESMADVIAKLAAGDRATHARWSFERRMDVFRKVLEALRYAHAQGVVHRDIKPANILLGPMGEVFVLDWGIARRVRQLEQKGSIAAPSANGAARSTGLETQAGAVVGTPHYMAPEQARGEPVDARSDLYSLCMTLWEFMTLTHPLAGLESANEVMQAVVTQPVPLATFQKHPHQATVPADINWILEKGLQKDPAARFQSADELLARLDDRSMGKVPIQCPITFTKRVGYEAVRLVQRSPILVMAVVATGLTTLLWLAARGLR